MPKTTVLITGACGFLGSHLAERLLREGAEVLGLDNFSTGQKKNQRFLEELSPERCEIVEADVAQPWNKILSGFKRLNPEKVSLVFHFASPASPPHYQRLSLETMWTNALGLKEALAFADAQKARVVFASTSEVYGDPEVSPQAETYVGHVNSFGPRACYDEAKRFGEALIYSHNERYKTRHGLLRIFNTFGPRMDPADGRVITNFVGQALAAKPLTIYGDGQQSRSFCYVDDLIEGIVSFAQNTKLVGPLNLGNDREFTILEAAQAVQKLFPEKKLEIKHLPSLPDDPKVRKPDLRLARDLLGWQAKISFEEGLKRMVSFMKHEAQSEDSDLK